MEIYKVENHADSLLPDGEWALVWADEFDGTKLDTTKWAYRTCMMGKKHPAWVENGVMLDGNSNLIFTLMKDENGNPVSSQLQTGFNFMDEPVKRTKFGADDLQWNIGKLRENLYTKKYGYFECRCKLQKSNSWWSAFWVQSPMIGASLDCKMSGTEIDIMECFEPGEVASHNAFTGGYGLDLKRKTVGGLKGLSPDEYHYFGMEWDENGYTFYVDGKENGVITDYVSGIPEFILISTEVKGYRFETHKPVKEAFENIGDTFTVDHIRVFERKTQI